MRAFILTALAAMTIAAPAYAGPVHVFGPGGPAPAMKEAAATFSKLRGVSVEVVAGPTSEWIEPDRAPRYFSIQGIQRDIGLPAIALISEGYTDNLRNICDADVRRDLNDLSAPHLQSFTVMSKSLKLKVWHQNP